MWLYGYSVRLPFFLDDGPHFQILQQTDVWQHWGDFPAFPFYRPVAFTLWKGLEFVFGGHNAPFLHLLNVLCFGLAGAVLGQIVRRLTKMPTAGLIAGIFFVVFPFSYQAVVMVAALFHLLLVLGITVCIWAALNWSDGRFGWPGLVLSWGAAFVAIFSHETGVLLTMLLPAALLIANVSRRRIVSVTLPVWGMALVYLTLWLLFRPQAGDGPTTDFTAGFATLLQGLAYPVAALLRPFVNGDIQPPLLVLIVAVTTLALLLLAWRHRLAVYGLGWYLLAILPAAVLLPAGYVLGQPRLALLASAGGAMLWGVALAWSFRSWWMLPKLAVLLLAVYISVDFLGMRRAEFLRLGDYNRQMVASLEAHNAAQRGAVLVNAPDYIAPAAEDRRFLLGTEGVLFVDATLDYNQQFWLNSDIAYDNIEVIAFPEIQRSTGFEFQPHPPVLSRPAVIDRVRDAPLVYVTQFTDSGGFYPLLVGGAVLESGADEAEVIYGDGAFTLLGAQVTRNDDMRLTVQTNWQTSTPEGVKLFIHVYCNETFIAQSDGYPWGDTYPFAAWQAGETQTDRRQINLPEPISPACLRVYTGLYREDDVTRLTAQNADSRELYPDNQYPVPITRESEEK